MKNYLIHVKNLPSKEKRIWTILEQAGFETYLVGGAVRDIVLGYDPKDFDFATIARPEVVIGLFEHYGFNVNFVGASFGVVLVDGVEVATFRGDRYNGGGDKDVEITYVKTIEEDLARRDFTINAMALDMNGNLIDPHGGFRDLFLSDIGGPLIKFVGDPNVRIWEDPNRIVRAFRFVARLDGIMDEDSFVSIQENRDKFSLIAPERVRLEILKTMESSKEASVFWDLMRLSGVLDLFIPELTDGVYHDHGNHHSEDVWTHNMIAGNAVSTKYPLIKLAAYLHDVGKPASFNNDLGTFYEHQHFGAEIVHKRLGGLKFSNDEIRYVVNLVLVHMDGTRGMSSKSRRRLKNKLAAYGIGWRDYVRIRIADRTANLTRSNFTINEIIDYINIFTLEEEVPVSVNSLSLSGGEIIALYGLTPGPIVGNIQREWLKLVIDEGDGFNTRLSLVALVEKEFNLLPIDNQ